MTLPILVTGGTGRLGRCVVSRLSEAGIPARVMSRHAIADEAGVRYVVGDATSGVGLDSAIDGVSAVIHCATNSKSDDLMAKNLMTAAARSGFPHILLPSIVGLDRGTPWGYTKRKLAAENALKGVTGRWTIMRSTQFFAYCFEYAERFAKFPLAIPVPADFVVQPVHQDEVAVRLVELATNVPIGVAPEFAGPTVTSWERMVVTYLAAKGISRKTIRVRVPGGAAAGRGALLPSPNHVTGLRSWDEYLSDQG